MTRLFSLPLLAAFAITGMVVLTAAPSAAHAQDDSGATAQDAGGGDDGNGAIDYGVGPEPDNYGGAGSEGTAGDSIYGGGGAKIDPSTPEGRAAMAAETKKRHDAMIQRMKANGDRMIEQSKKRAWQLAHPGKPYDPQGTNADGEEKSEADIMDEGTAGGDPADNAAEDTGGDDNGADAGDDNGGMDDNGGDAEGGQ